MPITPITREELEATLVSNLPLQPARFSRYGAAPMSGEEIRAAFDASTLLLYERLNQVLTLLSGQTADAAALSLAEEESPQ